MSNVSAKDIMLKNVLTIGPDEKLALARLIMVRQGVGGLPVVKEDNVLVGIITQRDIAFAGGDILTLQVKDLMTRNLITGTEKTNLLELADMMSKTGIQRIPIIDEDRKLVGLVTQSVLIRAFRNILK